MKAKNVRRLSGFHNHCIRTMLGVFRMKQWKEWITSKKLAETFGMKDLTEILRKYCLRWLGHVVRMDDSRLPKQLYFGELVRLHPRYGTKKQWRGLAMADLRVKEIEEM